MVVPVKDALVRAVPERCRLCYTCVRECPAKAIRITEGQASVVTERCIGCGNCVRVCSQNAKEVASSVAAVEGLLAGEGPVAAMVAPSFPAEFPDLDAGRLVGMLRALGFGIVTEVAFGADLVADRVRRLLRENPKARYVSTACPAIVGYVERYHPQLVAALAPVASPMIAMARALHRLHGDGLKVVFVGPCIAKKAEAASPNVAGEVDAALTFVELRQMWEARGVTAEGTQPSGFDPPEAGLGTLFPISRGMLQAARLSEDLLAGEIVATEGRVNFVEAIREFESGDLDARLLEVLCCEGCIMGAGMSTKAALFSRRSRVSEYARRRLEGFSEVRWRKQLVRFADLDLSRTYSASDQRIVAPLVDEVAEIMARMGKLAPGDELNCGACGYDTCREHAVAIHRGLAESEMCLPYTIEQLRSTVEELDLSNAELARAQEALTQSEKLASMGQLAAGIAHEINNPLGVVLMFAHMLREEVGSAGRSHDDLTMIVEQADRCKRIVSGLLHFARQNKVLPEPTDMRELLAHTIEAVRLPAGIECRIETSDGDLEAEVDRDQMAQVFTNLISNAQEAMKDEGKLTIAVGGDADRVWVAVSDTGPGIPKDIRQKIFEPFFTTKQMGRGTGLGLAVTYGIVKMHGGDIGVESNADGARGPTGSTFTVRLPRRARQDELQRTPAVREADDQDGTG